MMTMMTTTILYALPRYFKRQFSKSFANQNSVRVHILNVYASLLTLRSYSNNSSSM